jgi:hypothetical protein
MIAMQPSYITFCWACALCPALSHASSGCCQSFVVADGHWRRFLPPGYFETLVDTRPDMRFLWLLRRLC